MTKGFPRTPIGELVLPVLTCNPIDRTSATDFRYIDLSSVDQQTKAVESDRRLPITEAPSRARQIVNAGDVLVSTVRPNLNAVAVVPDRLDGAIASTGFCVLRPNNSVLHCSYLFHWVRTESFVTEMVRRATGASYPAISDRIVNESTIPLPPIKEQRRIAAILDKADSLRQKRRIALQKLDSLTQSIFLDMFGDPATNPKGLPIEPLGGSLLFVTSGGRGWAKYYSENGSRFIRSLDVRMNSISDSDMAFVNPPDNAEARRTKTQVGDVLLTITGSRIGRVASVPSGLEGSFISQHVAIIRLDQKRMNPTFVSFFLSLETGGKRQIANVQYGQTKPGLNFEQIRWFQIPTPPIEDQNRFVTMMKEFEKLRKTVLHSSVEANTLFVSLQHRAFQGEL